MQKLITGDISDPNGVIFGDPDDVDSWRMKHKEWLDMNGLTDRTYRRLAQDGYVPRVEGGRVPLAEANRGYFGYLKQRRPSVREY